MEVNQVKERIAFLSGLAVKAQDKSAHEPAVLSQAVGLDGASGQEDIHSALLKEFPFAGNYMPLSDSDRDAIYGLFQWIAMQLALSPESESYTPVDQVLIVCSILDWGPGQLWTELASVGSLHESRLLEIQQLIGSRDIDVAASMRFRSGRHFVDKSFSANCERQDWPGIDLPLDHVQDFLCDALLSQATQVLNAFAPAVLASAFDEMHKVPSLLIMLGSISPLRSLQLAAASSNWPLKFLALRLSMKKIEEVSAEFQDLCTQLLCQAAENIHEWPKWMTVFNAFPSRYPALQPSLGRALCTMPSQAVMQYFEAINMSSISRREDMAAAFSVILQHGNETQRKLVWERAYHRWSDWNFEKKDPSRHLFSIKASALDIAVVAYYRECLNQKGREMVEASLQVEFLNVEQAWHEELSDYLSAFNRHLSRYQPFGHAQYPSCSDEEWQRGSHLYHPSWIPDHPYWQMRHRVV